MTIAQSMLPEFDQEMAGTRKVLERLPDAKLGWRPHPKSFTLGELAGHTVNAVEWCAGTLRSTEFDLAPPGGQPWKSPTYASRAQMLSAFDANRSAARAAIAAAADADFAALWSLKQGGKIHFTLPRIAVLRSMVMNHMIHHRGQLTVYLRLLDLPLPALYGPSADES